MGLEIRIQGVADSIDGVYPLDPEFDYNAFRLIKQVAGLRPPELADALEAGDMELIVAFAMIALEQNGKAYQANQLWRAKFGAITLAGDQDEEPVADPTPPAAAGEPGPRSESSGNGSSGPGDSFPETGPPNGSGTPTSDTYATFDR